MQPTHKVFISATSVDLGSHRQLIKEVLLTNSILPVEQTNFPPDYRTVEAMLEAKIRSCDAVVCLVGFVYGAEPSERPADQPRRSYTQMELDIARRLGKPVYQFLADDDCTFDSRPNEKAELRELQVAHRRAIESGLQLWERFSAGEQLRQRIAHIQFGRPGPGQAHPQNLPYVSLGQLFKGRESFLKSIREHVLAKSHQANGAHAAAITQRQALCGLGGVGKTRLAVEYGWRYNEEYNAILFVVADSPENLRRHLAQLTGPLVLNLPEQNRQEEEVKMAAAIRWLVEHPGWFLILDNVDNRTAAQAVEDMLALVPGGHILITSKLNDWSKGVEPLELDVLSSEDAKAFILDRTQARRRRMPDDDSQAASLSRELDGLALALEQAGAFIERQRCSLAEYLNRWRAGETRVWQWFDPRLMHSPRSVAITYDTTMAEVGPSAATFFRLLSYFAPDPMPQGMLESAKSANVLAKLVQHSPHLEVVPEDALAELSAFSMLKRIDVQEVPCFSQHRLVQEITQKQILPEERNSLILGAVDLLMDFAPKDAYRFEVWKDWRLLVSHAEALWKVVKALHRDQWNMALMEGLALCYLGQDRYDEGIPIQRELLKLRELRLGIAHPETLLAKNDLALFLNSSGNSREAQCLYREALAVWEGIATKESDFGFGETLHNLGFSLKGTGDLIEAESILRRALAIFQKKSGEFHWRTLMTEYSLAQTLLAKGEVENAVALLRLNITKKTEHLQGNENHPDTLDSIQTLAKIRLMQGDLEEAEDLAKRAMEGREKSLGKDDPSTLQSVAILEAIYRRSQKLVMATDLRNRLVDSFLRSGNPDTFRNLNNQSHELRKRGYASEAEPIDSRLVKATVKVLGEANVLTIHRRNNLVLTLVLLGKLQEAKEMLAANWQLNASPIGNITPRIIYLRYIVALLGSEPYTPFPGQLKILLTGPELPVASEVAVPWDVAYFIEHLRPKLPPGKADFLTALVDALNDRAKLPNLEQFAEWKNQAPVPLDAPWP